LVEPQPASESRPEQPIAAPGQQQDPQQLPEPEIEHVAPIRIQAIPDEPVPSVQPAVPATEAAPAADGSAGTPEASRPAPQEPTTPDPKPAAPDSNDEFQPFSPPDFD
jgi:hypothetical protein